jgi:hypothetical protein
MWQKMCSSVLSLDISSDINRNPAINFRRKILPVALLSSTYLRAKYPIRMQGREGQLFN